MFNYLIFSLYRHNKNSNSGNSESITEGNFVSNIHIFFTVFIFSLGVTPLTTALNLLNPHYINLPRKLIDTKISFWTCTRIPHLNNYQKFLQNLVNLPTSRYINLVLKSWEMKIFVSKLTLVFFLQTTDK